MKKTAILGAVLLLAGLLAALVGFALSDGDLTVVNGKVGPFSVDVGNRHQVVGFGSTGKAEKWEERVPSTNSESVSYDYDADEVTIIDVTESAANIVVEPSRDGDVHVTVEESSHRRYTLSCKDGVLRVKSKVSDDVKRIFGSWELAEVRLAIPAGTTLDVENDAGSIVVTAVDLLAAELACDAGNIELSDVKVAGKLVIDCDAGNVELSGVDAGAIRAETDAGNIELDRVGAYGGMNFNCSLGDVSGTLRGHMDDYAIASDVDLGENNLPESTRGGVKLVVEVDCGNIEIEFEED